MAVYRETSPEGAATLVPEAVCRDEEAALEQAAPAGKEEPHNQTGEAGVQCPAQGAADEAASRRFRDPPPPRRASGPASGEIVHCCAWGAHDWSGSPHTDPAPSQSTTKSP